MRLRPHEIKNTIRTGVFITASGIVAMTFIFFLGKESKIFSSVNIYKSQVKNADNLKIGAAVHLKGVKVGSVRSIDFKSLNEIEFKFSVDKNYSEWVRRDSVVYIKTQGMLGDKYLEISGGSDVTSPADNGAFLEPGGAAGIGKFISQGEGLVGLANQIMSKISTLLDDINGDHQVKDTLINLSQTSEGINEFIKSLDARKITRSLDNLNKATSRLDKVAKRITEGPGTAHSFIYDSSVYNDIRQLLGGAQRNKVLKYFIRESIKKSQEVEK